MVLTHGIIKPILIIFVIEKLGGSNLLNLHGQRMFDRECIAVVADRDYSEIS